jgi:hypothetical protein
MEEITFALPTLGSTRMSRVDQGALLTDQAAAFVVSAWLEHCNAVLQADAALPDVPGHTTVEFLVNRKDLVELIVNVRNALTVV